MYKINIKYTDYNGNEKAEDFFFHLNKAEIMEWEFSEVGGLKAKIERIIASESVPEIADLFKEIITNPTELKILPESGLSRTKRFLTSLFSRKPTPSFICFWRQTRMPQRSL